MRRQSALLTLTRCNLYYNPKDESAENLRLMTIVDRLFLVTPSYGSRQSLVTFPAVTFTAKIHCRSMNGTAHESQQLRLRAASCPRLMRLMQWVPISREPNASSIRSGQRST